MSEDMSKYLRATFTRHDGTILEFGDGIGGIYVDTNDLRDWSLDTTDYGGRPSLLRKAVTKTLNLVVRVMDAEDGPALRDALEAGFYPDTDNRKSDTLSVNGWSVECYVTAVSHDHWWLTDRLMEVKASLYLPDPIWRRETTHAFEPYPSTASGGYDYPHDYPIDFGPTREGLRTIKIDATAPVGVKLIVYGAVENPVVTVGNRVYQVNTTVEDGGYLVVDPTKKGVPGESIYKRGKTGIYANCFDSRERGDKDSGTYIFDTVKPGEQLVHWDGSFGFDLTLIEERGTPTWS